MFEEDWSVFGGQSQKYMKGASNKFLWLTDESQVQSKTVSLSCKMSKINPLIENIWDKILNILFLIKNP